MGAGHGMEWGQDMVWGIWYEMETAWNGDRYGMEWGNIALNENSIEQGPGMEWGLGVVWNGGRAWHGMGDRIWYVECGMEWRQHGMGAGYSNGNRM